MKKNNSTRIFLFLAGGVVLTGTIICGIVGAFTVLKFFPKQNATDSLPEATEILVENKEIEAISDNFPKNKTPYLASWSDELKLPQNYSPYLVLDPYQTEYGSVVYHARFISQETLDNAIGELSTYLNDNNWNVTASGYAYENVYSLFGERLPMNDTITIIIHNSQIGLTVQLSVEIFEVK